MMTSLDAVDKVFERLSEADFKATLNLSGSLYKTSRPLNSDKEDIVVSSQVLVDEDETAQGGEDSFQDTIVINIHVPNLRLTINGKADNTQPDTQRFQMLTTLVIAQIREVYYGSIWFYFKEVSGLVPNGSGYLISIKVDFYAIDTDGSNAVVITQPDNGIIVISTLNEW